MQPYSLILFDLDDTLVFFDDYWAECSKAALMAHPLASGLEAEALFAEFRKLDREQELLYLAEQITLREFRVQRFIGAFSAFQVTATSEDADRYEHLFRPTIKRYLKPDLEQVSFLEKLSRKYRLGIVSNGTHHLQMDKLEGAGLAHLFPDSSVFCSDTIGHSKPYAPIYEAALRHFAASPEETLFVGDSWDNDVVGPSRLGMQTVWLHRGDGAAPASALPADKAAVEPLRVIRHVAELQGDLL